MVYFIGHGELTNMPAAQSGKQNAQRSLHALHVGAMRVQALFPSLTILVRGPALLYFSAAVGVGTGNLLLCEAKRANATGANLFHRPASDSCTLGRRTLGKRADGGGNNSSTSGLFYHERFCVIVVGVIPRKGAIDKGNSCWPLVNILVHHQSAVALKSCRELALAGKAELGSRFQLVTELRIVRHRELGSFLHAADSRNVARRHWHRCFTCDLCIKY